MAGCWRFGCLALIAMLLAVFPSCKKMGAGFTGHKECKDGEKVWLCFTTSTACWMVHPVFVCAADSNAAFVAAKEEATDQIKPQNPDDVVIASCEFKGGTVLPQSEEPSYTSRDENCDPDAVLTRGTGGAGGAGGTSDPGTCRPRTPDDCSTCCPGDSCCPNDLICCGDCDEGC